MSFSFIPGIRVKSRHLIDETILKFVSVGCFFSTLLKKKVMGKHKQNKRPREKGTCNTVL